MVTFRAGVPVGFATYRQKSKWDDAIADGSVMVGEVLGIDGNARLSLWSLLCSIDLIPNVAAGNLPVDMELPWQVSNPRLIRRKLVDGMYVRLLDVPAALEARGYLTTDRIRLEVIDDMGIATGRFVLEVAPEGALCAVLASDVAKSAAVRAARNA